MTTPITSIPNPFSPSSASHASLYLISPKSFITTLQRRKSARFWHQSTCTSQYGVAKVVYSLDGALGSLGSDKSDAKKGKGRDSARHTEPQMRTSATKRSTTMRNGGNLAPIKTTPRIRTTNPSTPVTPSDDPTQSPILHSWPSQLNSHLYLTSSGDLIQDNLWRVFASGSDCAFVRNEEWEREQKKRKVARMRMRNTGPDSSRSTGSRKRSAPSTTMANTQQSDSNGGIFFWLNMYGQLYICVDRDALALNKQLSLWTQLKVNEIHSSGFCINVVESRSQIASGMGDDGFLGQQKSSTSSFALPTTKTKRILKMAVGPNHLIFMTQTRVLYAMGRGRYGACGTGIDSAEWIFQPVEVCFHIPHTTYVKKMRCGDHHTLILLGNGEVFGCGSNHFGELGKGSETKRVSIPQRIEIPSFTDTFVIDMDCSQQFSVFITKDYKVYCCGTGSAFGQRGEVFVPYKLDMTSFRCLSDKYLQKLRATSARSTKMAQQQKHSSSWEQLLEANNVIDSLQETLVTKSADDLFDEFRIPHVERVFCGHECTFYVTTDQRVFFAGKNTGIVPSENAHITAPTEIYLEPLDEFNPKKASNGKQTPQDSSIVPPEDELRPTIDDIYSTRDFVHIVRSFHEEEELDLFAQDHLRENVEYGL